MTTTEITRQDVTDSVAIHNDMLKSASKYYRKVLELSQASTEFANSLDKVARCKGAEHAGQGLKSAAELHRQMALHHHQLAESIHKEFELPLQRNLAAHTKRSDENEKNFDKTMRKMQDDISKTEGKMLKGRKKDHTMFQQSLKDMQRQAEELEVIKAENTQRIYADEQNHVMFLVQKAAGMVKSEYDNFTALSGLSREATEDIITIAFSPAGVAMDEEQRKRVVDKYLGSGNSPVISRADSSLESRRTSLASQTSVPVAQLPQVTQVANSSRSFTPPVTPQPQAFTRTASSGMIRRQSNGAQVNPAIQESLKRLNVASAQASSQAGPLSPQSRSDSNVSAQMSTGVTSPSLEKVEEESLDLVEAVHDFKARSDRELSFGKGDILLVKQRQDNWLYATHHGQVGGKSGWIPVSYTHAKK